MAEGRLKREEQAAVTGTNGYNGAHVWRVLCQQCAKINQDEEDATTGHLQSVENEIKKPAQFIYAFRIFACD